MGTAFLFGLMATSSLILGGFVATTFTLSRSSLGIILAFGAGTLLSAISYELIFEAVRLARFTGFPMIGFFSGAATFFVLVQCELEKGWRTDSHCFRHRVEGMRRHRAAEV